jgi:hypothetical protein
MALMTIAGMLLLVWAAVELVLVALGKVPKWLAAQAMMLGEVGLAFLVPIVFPEGPARLAVMIFFGAAAVWSGSLQMRLLRGQSSAG